MEKYVAFLAAWLYDMYIQPNDISIALYQSWEVELKIAWVFSFIFIVHKKHAMGYTHFSRLVSIYLSPKLLAVMPKHVLIPI